MVVSSEQESSPEESVRKAVRKTGPLCPRSVWISLPEPSSSSSWKQDEGGGVDEEVGEREGGLGGGG